MEIPLAAIKKKLDPDDAVEFWAALEALTVEARRGGAARSWSASERRAHGAAIWRGHAAADRRRQRDRLAPGAKDVAKAPGARWAAKSRHGLARSIPTIVLEAMQPDVWHTWRDMAGRTGLKPYSVKQAMEGALTSQGYVEQQIRKLKQGRKPHNPAKPWLVTATGAPRVAFYRLTEKGRQARLEGRPEAKRLPAWMMKLQACMKTPRVYRGDYGAESV